jgi:hypothetical protein
MNGELKIVVELNSSETDKTLIKSNGTLQISFRDECFIGQ